MLVARTDSLGPSKDRRVTALLPWGCGVQFGVHNADVSTTLRGLLTRVFFHKEAGELVRPFRPLSSTVRGLLAPARNEVLRHTWFVAPYTDDQFVECYVGRKKAIYGAARDSLRASPVERKDAYLKTFVKAEKLNLTAKPDPDPRVIQPRTPRYNLSIGRYIKACEHMIYKAIDKAWGHRTVMKGLNADKRGRAIASIWASFDDPAAVGADASRFDQHVSKALLEIEHSVYNSIFRDPELKRLLKWQLLNKGFVYAQDGKIKYQVEGSRMSGDMNTSLGNVLLMCLMMRAYANTKNFRIALINDGDDCVLLCERKHVGDLADMGTWFQQLGMVMVAEEPVFELEQLEFCQSRPIEITDGVYRMVRDPRVVLSKDLITIKPVQGEADYMFYRRAIGQCGLSLAGDVPVMWQFYQAMMRGTTERHSAKSNGRKRVFELETGMQYLALGMNEKCSEPTTAARVSFAKAFGIMPDLQLALEREYSRLDPTWEVPVHVFGFGNLIADRL